MAHLKIPFLFFCCICFQPLTWKNTIFMFYKVPFERSFEYKLTESYTALMCTAGMSNFIINKPNHKSTLSITETNWFSWDIYLSCGSILAWLSQAEKYRNHRLKFSTHKNHRLKTVKMLAKGILQKTWRTSAGPVPFLQFLVSLYFLGYRIIYS